MAIIINKNSNKLILTHKINFFDTIAFGSKENITKHTTPFNSIKPKTKKKKTELLVKFLSFLYFFSQEPNRI